LYCIFFRISMFVCMFDMPLLTNYVIHTTVNVHNFRFLRLDLWDGP
jgi:hypothetical protein